MAGERPLDAPYEFATGVYAGISRTVARVTTDTGLVGLGESPSPTDAPDLWEQAPNVAGRDAASLLDQLASDRSPRRLRAIPRDDRPAPGGGTRDGALGHRRPGRRAAAVRAAR